MGEEYKAKSQDVSTQKNPRDVATEDRRERTLLPPVDIYEEGDAIHVLADMPGVSKEALTIEMDGTVLTIYGDIQIEMPEGISATYAEVRGSRYYRRFTLGQEVETDGIRAEINHGVLSVVLPKKASHRRWRIEVTARLTAGLPIRREGCEMNFDLSKWNPFRFLRKSPEERRAGTAVPIGSRPRDPSREGFESTGSIAVPEAFGLMQELMREPLSGWGYFDRWFGDFSPSVFQPRVDMVDDGDALRITAELPGMERDDVEIHAEDGYLWIRGEKKLESRSEEKGCYRVERAFGQFQRAIPLPDGTDVEKARASFDKGLLTIRLPKPEKQESGARRIAIQ